MRKLCDLENVEHGRNMIIVCCGYSITEYKDKIRDFIKEKDAVAIGMNKMTNLVIPKYHLWTNKKRWKHYGHIMKLESIGLIGGGLDFDKIRKNTKSECIRVSHTDDKGIELGYKDNHIDGYFRSTGNLSIMLCDIMGAKNIYLVGLDGLTLHPKKDYESLERKHHCDDYGNGYTAEHTWENCKEVDRNILYSLNMLKDYGIKFKVLTPTKFKDYYDPNILGI